MLRSTGFRGSLVGLDFDDWILVSGLVGGWFSWFWAGFVPVWGFGFSFLGSAS